MSTSHERTKVVSRFKGKVVAVTGSARGIGKNIVSSFAREGGLVVVCDINSENGNATVKNLQKQGLSAEFLHVNLSENGAPQAMIQEIVTNHGRLDVLVNNARARSHSGTSMDDEKSWDSEIAVTLRAAYFATQEAIYVMARHCGGSIVNISSINAILESRSVTPIYHIAKAGLTQLTRSFAVRAGSNGVRVNALLPGFILQDEHVSRYERNDNQRYRELVEFCHPMGQPGRSDNIADAVLFLCSPEATFISGQCLAIDGASSVQEQFDL
ncbi:MAG: SDR family NAD(P)-dependent oxidoreductase, partial [Anaerolineales bacterium]|nr:SDR family NAD(P)-dependent oxidoreductase [Anaerolineales bacterium]